MCTISRHPPVSLSKLLIISLMTVTISLIKTIKGNEMKKLLLAALFLTSISVFADDGALDSKGCHYSMNDVEVEVTDLAQECADLDNNHNLYSFCERVSLMEQEFQRNNLTVTEVIPAGTYHCRLEE